MVGPHGTSMREGMSQHGVVSAVASQIPSLVAIDIAISASFAGRQPSLGAGKHPPINVAEGGDAMQPPAPPVPPPAPPLPLPPLPPVAVVASELELPLVVAAWPPPEPVVLVLPFDA